MKSSRTLRFAQWIVLLGFPLFFFLFFIIHPTLLTGQEEEGEKVPLEELQAQVKTVLLQPGELAVTLKSMGTYVPRQQSPVAVVSRMAGIVKEIVVQDGQTVEAGQILLRLDDRIASNNLAKAEAGLRLVEAELQKAKNGGLDTMQSDLDLAAKKASVDAEQAKLESEREHALFAEHLTSEKAAQDAKIALEEAIRKSKSESDKAQLFKTTGRDLELKRLQAAVDQAQAEKKAAELETDSVAIRAPLAGRIGGLKVSIGASIDDKTALAQVTGDKTSVFRLWVSPQDAVEIRTGFQTAIHTLSSEDPLSATVVSIGGELDSETGLVPIEAQVDSQQFHLPRIGESVMAEIVTQSNAKGFLVPVSALTIEDDKASVFLVDDKQIAHAVPVTILARNAEKAVAQGESLAEGNRLIVDGNFNLPDGAHVVEEPAQ